MSGDDIAVRPLDRLLQQLEGVRRNGSSFSARCPVANHGKGRGDLNPSLSIREDDGQTLVHCHAGCSTTDILAQVGLRLTDLYEGPEHGNIGGRKVATPYDYHDAGGRLLFQVVRYEPKDFRQRHPDGKGGWVWNIRGIEPVLYQLREVLQAIESGATIYLTEGEKDVNRLRALGVTATTNPMGATKWRNSYSETLRGANVVIVPDNDRAGKEHAERVAQNLADKAASVRVLQLHDLPGGGDVSDWLDAGGTVRGTY